MNLIQQCHADHANVTKQANGRMAVIVSTQLNKRKAIVGIQFWTQEMIACGSAANTDGTVSNFIEVL